MSDDSWGGIGDEYTDSSESSETSNNSETHETSETDGARETPEMIETPEPAESADSSDKHGDDETAETGNTHKTSGTAETSDSGKTNIREEWNGRTLYLDDELAKEVDLTFDELALQAKRDDEDLKKNRDFYPAVFRAALNETSITEELGLE